MRNKRFFSALYELLSSMRFAVSLLTLIAIASIIGTVLKQNEPFPNYQLEFGSFWFSVFEKLGLYDVYHAGWFLLIFAFLVYSTSLCIYRHFPGVVREIRSFRRQAKAQSLRLMPNHTEFPVGSAFTTTLPDYLKNAGYVFRHVQVGDTRIWAAKKGHLQKLGYLFAHVGIIVICIGGLLDGNVILKSQEWLGLKTPEERHLSAKNMPPASRLSEKNTAFRAHVSIPEGRAVDFAWINAGRGAFLQPLPFTLELQAFRVNYYTTGQPKLFASDVIVHDKRTGQKTVGTVQVNHPLIIDDIAIYQASFGDGGSALKLHAWNLDDTLIPPKKLQATSLTDMPLMINSQPYQIEWGELRVLNIENMGKPPSTTAVTHSAVFQEKLKEVRDVKPEHHLRNVGPNIQFKLRDAQGQAREYINYMQPFAEENRYYLLSGMRKVVGGEIQFIRFPLDNAMSIATFMRLRAILLNKKYTALIAQRTADKSLANNSLRAVHYAPFIAVIKQVLTQFQQAGFRGVERLLEEVPLDKRSTIAQTYSKILQAATLEAMQLAQTHVGQTLPTPPINEQFLLDSLVATSHLFDYGAPIYLQLTHFQQVQASGFQITRAPGKKIVYIGCLLLILGVMVMFYIREMRLWIHVQQNRALLAMSSNRKDQELPTIFAKHAAALQKLGQENIQ